MGVTIRTAFDILRRTVSGRTDTKLSEDNDDSHVNYRQLYQRKSLRAEKPRKKKNAAPFLRGYYLTLKMETAR
jgi:hypothetical protein